MSFRRYLTKNEFDAPELGEVLEFHDRTELKPYASYELFLRIGNYVNSVRGSREQSANFKDYGAGATMPVPAYTQTDDFMDVLQSRASCRTFDRSKNGDRTNLKAVLSMCVANRTQAAFDDDEVARISQRPYPSAGGLYPSEVYLILNENDQWAVHHLDPIKGELRRISNQTDEQAMVSAFCSTQPNFVHDAVGAFVLTSVLERSVAKYGFTGYRFAMMELGIIGHHISLCLSKFNFGNVHWGGATDAEAEQILGIDGVSEVYGHTIWFGRTKDGAA